VIVVAGSRHDPVAQDLVRRWPAAALCGAEDLVRPGWRWPGTTAGGRRTWVIDGTALPDSEVTGVFIRRSAVYPDELTGTHPDDRAYLAAEVHAFLVFVLATTGARVVNPARDGTLGTDAMRPERWIGVASRLGVPVARLRLTSATPPPPADATTIVEVVGGDSMAAPLGPLGEAAVAVTGALGLTWAVAAFDGSGRLSGLSTIRAPSAGAARRLGRLLGARTT
jgi:hypothetical protein